MALTHKSDIWKVKKIHLNQIRKLNPSDYKENSEYYSTYIKIIYNYIIFGKYNSK